MQVDQQATQLLEQALDMARANPLIAVGALVVVLFLTSLLPAGRRTRAKRYGGRTMSHHMGRIVGEIVRGRSRRG